MATYDLTTVPNSAYQIYSGDKNTTRRHVFNVATDFTTQNAADAGKLFPIYPGEFITNVYLRIITASTTGSSTLQVGDSASATNWVASQAATAAGVYAATGSNIFTQTGTAVPYAVTWAGGKYYAAADYILVTLGSTAPANGVFEVIAVIDQILTDTAV